MLIYVVGMHRSGTSATTRVLNLLGASLGDESELMAPQPDNPRGFWESRMASGLNERILQSMGGSWDAPPALSGGWEQGGDVRRWRRDIRVFFDGLMADGAGVHALKDPRLSLTMPLWMLESPDEFHVVMPIRDPLAVCQSLQRRNGIPLDRGAELWQRYVGDALAAAPDSLIVDYETLVSRPQVVVDQLVAHLGLDAPAPAVRDEVAGFIEPDLNHFDRDVDTPPELRAAQHMFAEMRSKIDGQILERTGCGGPSRPRVRAQINETGNLMNDAGYLQLETTLSTADLVEKLRSAQPWGHRIDFSNGVSTRDMERRTPFSENPLAKFGVIAKSIPFEDLRGGTLLDIGSNSGHNSIHAAARYGMRVTGIDVTERHMKMSRFLAELGGVDAEFRLEDAETFSRPQHFDVVLHLGTLYHLPNPLLSLKTTVDNLKPGGYLAVETQTYDDPSDPDLCAFIHMRNNDPTNFWAISENVLRRYLESLGMTRLDTLLRTVPKIPGEDDLRHQHRIILTAQKPR